MMRTQTGSTDSTMEQVRTCDEPRSHRNPYQDHCRLPAGHGGAHEWMATEADAPGVDAAG